MPSTEKNASAGEVKTATKLTPTKVGVVESDKRDKTRTVVVRFMVRHPKYGKFIRRRTVLQVHDEKNESRLGDTVEVSATRPISKTKSWKLVRVVERGAGMDLVGGQG